MTPVPALGPTRRLTFPETVKRVLPSGLTVLAVRRASVSLVEVRLRLPFAGADVAEASVITQTLLSGTVDLSSVDIAAELRKVGGELKASADPDWLTVSGNGLAAGLPRLLELLCQVLCGATYPADEVATERARLAERIRAAQRQPGFLARVALLKRMYGCHAYAVQTPHADEVRAVGPGGLRTLHAERIRPAGAALVIVGDVDPDWAVDEAERALSSWDGEQVNTELPPTPALQLGPLTLIDRPTAVQSSLRLALPAVPRTHPDHAALQLANLVFGGYFSSRWVENIREEKGYTYGPHSKVEHSVAGSAVTMGAEVATKVTAPALLETTYELGRLASLPPREDELRQAQQYALGSLQLGLSTQAGLAELAITYAGFGQSLEYLAGHAARLAGATCDDVVAAAARYLAPARAVTVVLGDADKVERSLAALTPLTRVASDET
jgi:predicted Zn-dependent peptidase